MMLALYIACYIAPRSEADSSLAADLLPSSSQVTTVQYSIPEINNFDTTNTLAPFSQSYI